MAVFLPGKSHRRKSHGVTKSRTLLSNFTFFSFPNGPVVMTMLPMQGAQVQLLVRELRSHISYVMQLIIIIELQNTPLLNMLSLPYQ